ncbi:hypothetical protein [Pseudoalteromonas phenolica]|uniref:hypothetical protein n=1 Tax=Pseudoalteromonas phenolica TaxID=161398 RepID=UPI00148730C4|nr:hypothetical protein [Pseudoalteromonas phenolica]
MHPFSLNKEEQQSVNGGCVHDPVRDSITFGIGETGGCVTMAIPEDGNDPYPFPSDVM